MNNIRESQAGLIRLATLRDLPGVMAIVAQTISEMQAYGNEQWNTDYPTQTDFEQDVEAQTLYLACKQDLARESSRQLAQNSLLAPNSLCGFVTIDQLEPLEYAPLAWRAQQPCYVIHRFAVATEHRGQGWASRLEAHALDIARQAQVQYLKTDTHSSNRVMQRFFEQRGYQKIGTMQLPGRTQDFCCYDKIVEAV